MSLWSVLRNLPTAFLARTRPGSPGRDFLLEEKILGTLRIYGNRVRFLPSVDQITEETTDMRLAYRQMLREPSIKAPLLQKILAVAQNEPQVHPASDRPVDKMASEFVLHCLKRARGGMRRMALGVLLPGLMDGYSVNEKVWMIENRGKWAGKIVLRYLKSKDTRYAHLEGDQYKNVLYVRDTRNNLRYNVDNFVVWSHLPIFENPTGWSDFRSAYRAYWLMDTAQKLRAIGLERFALPVLKGEYEDPEMRPTLEEAIQNLRSLGWISLPKGAQIEALDLATRSQPEFTEAIQDLRQEMFLAIAGAMLQSLQGTTTDGRGNSETHKDTAELLPWYLAAELADVIAEQVCHDLVDMNFTEADYPTITLGSVSDETLAASLQIDKGLQEMGLVLSKKELYEKYGRQPPDDPDDSLAPPQPPGSQVSYSLPQMGGQGFAEDSLLSGVPGPVLWGQPGSIPDHQPWARFSGSPGLASGGPGSDNPIYPGVNPGALPPWLLTQAGTDAVPFWKSNQNSTGFDSAPDGKPVPLRESGGPRIPGLDGVDALRHAESGVDNPWLKPANGNSDIANHSGGDDSMGNTWLRPGGYDQQGRLWLRDQQGNLWPAEDVREFCGGQGGKPGPCPDDGALEGHIEQLKGTPAGRVAVEKGASLAGRVYGHLKAGVAKALDAIDKETNGGLSLLQYGVKSRDPGALAAAAGSILGHVFQNVHQEVYENALSQHSIPGAHAIGKGLASAAAAGENAVLKGAAWAMSRLVSKHSDEFGALTNLAEGTSLTPADERLVLALGSLARQTLWALYSHAGTEAPIPSAAQLGQDILARLTGSGGPVMVHAANNGPEKPPVAADVPNVDTAPGAASGAPSAPTADPLKKKTDVAPTGAHADQARAEQLLSASIRHGVATLADISKTALGRLAHEKEPGQAQRLFNDDEMARLADCLASIGGTANLLGRSRIQIRADKANAAQGASKFAEEPTDFARFDGTGSVPMPPREAVDYFNGLVPSLGVDPKIFGELMQRHAFTMAAVTDKTMLDRAKQILSEALQSGDVRASHLDIQELMDKAGVSPRNPQYAQMVVRTNLMDAYNTGSHEQMKEVADTFPVWQYSGIRDGRQGKDHEPHFDKYFPAHVSFAEVRGNRPFNCRCTSIPVDKWSWEKLQGQGARMEKFSDNAAVSRFDFNGPIDWGRFCENATLLPLPDVAQEDDYSCGAAACCSVGNMLGVGPGTVEGWKKLLGTTPDGGTTPDAIISAFVNLGCQVAARQLMTLEDLKNCWLAGTPVICPIQDYGDNPGPVDWDDGHYVTVAAVDLGQVIVQDSSADNATAGSGTDANPGKVMIDEKKFCRVWHDQGIDGRFYIRYGIAISR